MAGGSHLYLPSQRCCACLFHSAAGTCNRLFATSTAVCVSCKLTTRARLAGSCGSGPEGKEYKIGWLILHEGGHVYIEPDSGREPTFITEEPDLNRISARQSANWVVPTGGGLFSIISTAFGFLKPRPKSRTERPTRRSPASDTEPLRSPRTTKSALSLHSQYELGDIETRTQQQ
jgi:hypothetical protein